jgi:hypothetical protein
MSNKKLRCLSPQPTERPPIVGEVSASGQRNEFPRPLISVSQTGAATFSFK